VEGSSLGLVIIEKTLANYSGKISIQSDIGKGATFIVTWPKTKAIGQ
jgi:signal transduction histidine kinase